MWLYTWFVHQLYSDVTFTHTHSCNVGSDYILRRYMLINKTLKTYTHTPVPMPMGRRQTLNHSNWWITPRPEPWLPKDVWDACKWFSHIHDVPVTNGYIEWGLHVQWEVSRRSLSALERNWNPHTTYLLTEHPPTPLPIVTSSFILLSSRL